MSYPFAYTVLLIDELSTATTSTSYMKESGLGICSSFTHAMEQIENYYADNLIAVKDLELLEEGSLLVMPHNFVQDYKNTAFADYAIPCDANGNEIFVEEESEIVRITHLPIEFSLKGDNTNAEM